MCTKYLKRTIGPEAVRILEREWFRWIPTLENTEVENFFCSDMTTTELYDFRLQDTSFLSLNAFKKFGQIQIIVSQ